MLAMIKLYPQKYRIAADLSTVKSNYLQPDKPALSNGTFFLNAWPAAGANAEASCTTKVSARF